MRKGFLVALGACLLLFVACGGSDDGSGNGDPAAEEQDNGSNDDGDSGSGGLSRDECEELAETIQSATGGDVGDTADAVAVMEELSENGPESLRDDFAVLAEAMGNYLDILAEAGIDPDDPDAQPSQEDLAALQEAAAELSKPEVAEAIQNISAGLTDLCVE